jgi:hypothetical protein
MYSGTLDSSECLMAGWPDGEVGRRAGLFSQLCRIGGVNASAAGRVAVGDGGW